MRKRTTAGRLIVTRRAIVDIVRAAVQGSYGVTGFSDPSFGRRLLRWVGLDQPGIQLTTEGGLALDLYVKVALGMPVAEVARQVDSAVRYSLRSLVGVEAASVTIHVDGLGYQAHAVERAEAIERKIERETTEPMELGQEAPAASSERDQAHKVPARKARVAGDTAAGKTAGRRRKTK